MTLLTSAPKRLFVRLWLQRCGGSGRLVIVLCSKTQKDNTSQLEIRCITCFNDRNSQSKVNDNSLEEVGCFLYNSSLLSCSPTSQFSVVFSPPPARSGWDRNIKLLSNWKRRTSTRFALYWEYNRKPIYSRYTYDGSLRADAATVTVHLFGMSKLFSGNVRISGSAVEISNLISRKVVVHFLTGSLTVQPATSQTTL